MAPASAPIRAPKRTRQRAFLAAFARLGTVTHAAEAAGIHQDTHRDWLHKDEQYAADFATAKAALLDKLEREAIRRATEGTNKPVYWRGEVVGHVTEYSDTLLIFLLKANAPEKYRERVQIDHGLVESVAAQLGLDPAEVLREAEALMRGER